MPELSSYTVGLVSIFDLYVTLLAGLCRRSILLKYPEPFEILLNASSGLSM